MNIGIFSGSFNPIHIGHLALANYLCEYGDLDEVWFMVTPHNPLKEENELMDDKLRLKLVQLATEGDPQFRGARPAVTDFAEKRVLQSAATAPTGIRHLHFPPSFVHGGEGPPGPASGPVPGHTPGGSSCPG